MTTQNKKKQRKTYWSEKPPGKNGETAGNFRETPGIEFALLECGLSSGKVGGLVFGGRSAGRFPAVPRNCLARGGRGKKGGNWAGGGSFPGGS